MGEDVDAAVVRRTELAHAAAAQVTEPERPHGWNGPTAMLRDRCLRRRGFGLGRSRYADQEREEE